MAAALDSAYYLYPYPYERLLLGQAMRWSASNAPGIEVQAPMCVQTTFFRQKKDGERLVVHFFNKINTTADSAFPDDDVPLREEVVSVHDLKLKLTGYKAKNIHLEPDGIALETGQEGEATVVSLPPLPVHYMVVIEL
jgi:hypothetical protein